ncbi:hypothetical protein I4U23_020256 [Adineta vaga]|nr:hypothetical protein I4U23_020256 [Adineta vaga]
MFRRFRQTSSDAEQQRAKTAASKFCLICWSDTSSYDIVSEQQVQESPDAIEHWKTYTIDFNGRQRKGTVFAHGTKKDCELAQEDTSSPSTEDSSETKTKGTSKPTVRSSQTAGGATPDIAVDVNEQPVRRSKSNIQDAQNQMFLKIFQLVLANAVGGTCENEEVHNVRCVSCRTKPIQSDRYKCLNCDDIDLCGPCFERRRESNEHKSGHAFVHFKSPGELFGQTVKNDEVTYVKLKKLYGNDVHESICCDGCKAETIKGLRFKCDSCPNYDLCQRCVDNGVTTKKHETSHSLIIVARRAIQQIPAEDIELGDELGSGAFGSVYKARWISKKRPVACKVITVPQSDNAERLEKSFLKEIAAYSELSGAYILKTYGFTASRYGPSKKYMLIMEYMSRGSLANVIKQKGDQLSLRRKLDIARNIACGMRKIHDHHMIHRDIRPDNILVNENYLAKIGDMGIARQVDPMNQHTQIGYQPYMPPEFYKRDYDQKLDIFMFGLTLNELFTSKKHSFQPLASNRIAFSEKSPVFDDLIAQCTLYDPKRRPTATEIEKTLDIYSAGFNEMVISKDAGYMKLSTEDKDKSFISFYEKFHEPATKFIRKKFPREVLEESTEEAGVPVNRHAGDEIRVECPMQ